MSKVFRAHPRYLRKADNLFLVPCNGQRWCESRKCLGVILSRSIIPGEAKNLSYRVGVSQVPKGVTVPSAVLPSSPKIVPYYDSPCLSCSSHHVLHVSASDRVGKRVYTESYFLHDCCIREIYSRMELFMMARTC